jgi:hypothetical protein
LENQYHARSADQRAATTAAGAEFGEMGVSDAVAQPPTASRAAHVAATSVCFIIITLNLSVPLAISFPEARAAATGARQIHGWAVTTKI